MMKMAIFLSVLVFTTILLSETFAQGPIISKVPRAYSTDLETELRDSLFSNYQLLQRPSKLVNVLMAFNLFSIRYLDIKEQTLAVSGYFRISWTDPRLMWMFNTTYNNIKFIFTNELNAWRPSLIVENSVDDIDVISKPQVPMRAISDGTVVWTPGAVYVTHCDSDITYYPLDTQSCDIIISTWAYTASEVNLLLFPEAINTDYFKENGEWDIIGLSSSVESTKRETQSFSRVTLSLKLRRRPLFHLLNTIFPVILMAFLIVIVFKLPVESGERLGMSLTVLLAYAVYLTLISESIPQTSLSASMLSYFLAVILLLSTFSVIFTIFVVDIYFRPEQKKVPRWLQVLVKKVLAKAVCWERLIDTDEVKPIQIEHETQSVTTVPQSWTKTAWPGIEIDPDDDDADGNESTRSSKNETEEEEEDFSWKEIAMVIDKCFLYLFFFLVSGTTAFCMAVLAAHYSSSY